MTMMTPYGVIVWERANSGSYVMLFSTGAMVATIVGFHYFTQSSKSLTHIKNTLRRSEVLVASEANMDTL